MKKIFRLSFFLLAVSIVPALCQASMTILTNSNPNHTITSGSDEKVYGTSASNEITLESGARAELFYFPGQNNIQIQSGLDLFTVSRSGTLVTFQGSDGTFLKMQATSEAQTISFNGGEGRVLQIHNNQVMLDDQGITTIPASILYTVIPIQENVLRFKGNEIARAPLIPELNLGSEFTMEVWVYLESYQPYAVIMGKPHTNRHTAPWMSYVIEVNQNGNFEFVQSTGLPGTYRSATASTTAAIKKWTHLAATLDNGTMRFYVDGHEAASTPSAGNPNNTTIPFSLGAGSDPSGLITCGGFSGALSQARIWNYALSPQEIAMFSNQALTGNETGLIACWPLDEGQGLTAKSIGNLDIDLTLGDANNSNRPDWVTVEFLDAIREPAFVQIDFQLLENFWGPQTGPQDAIPFDYDGDGDLDLIIPALQWPPPEMNPDVSVAILENRGSNSFVHVTGTWAENIKFTHPRHWAVSDFNKDGRMDLVIADHGSDVDPFPGGQSKILISQDNGILADETTIRFPTIMAFTHNIAVGDIIGNGHPDIYMCNISGQQNVGPRFYMNNGAGVFSVDTSRIPAEISSLEKKYTSAALADIDNDGDLDLILGGHDCQNRPKDTLLLNNGSGIFTYAQESAMPDRVLGSNVETIAVTPGDFNNDGWVDLLMAVTLNYQTPSLQLLLNNQDGTFLDASGGIPQSWPTSPYSGDSWVRWTLPGDFNGDGLLDFLAVGQGICPTKLYFNTGNADFREVTDYAGLDSGANINAIGDFSGDGRTDILQVRSNNVLSLFVHNRDIFSVVGDVK